MKWLRRALAALGVLLAALSVAVLAVGFPPAWGAGAILHPSRRPVGLPPALPHRDVVVEAGDVTLKGWFFPAEGSPRGITVVYLHGSADNRDSGNWIAERLVPKGFDVLAYDGRGHGETTGTFCSYGVLEKRDLRRVLDQLGVRRAVLVGGSLGAAVALQAAPDDPRVVAVVAASTFSDLESIARDRAPITMRASQIREALALAEAEAGFRVADASPLRAAARITVPVLLIHGADDVETSAEHSRRVYAALPGPKTLRIVEKAGHNGPLSMAWGEVEAWLDEQVDQERLDDARVGEVTSGLGAGSRRTPDAAACAGFRLTAEQVRAYLRLSKVVSARDFHQGADWAPCVAKADVEWRSGRGVLEISALYSGRVLRGADRVPLFLICDDACQREVAAGARGRTEPDGR